ncbi:MAG: hypothetical protein LUI12_01680 [Clostridiales bacterium]|nr:hypothetical protein [Clostridiales bacterium]
MAILELWIKSSKSIQEMETKLNLVRDGLNRIQHEFLKEREGNKDVH